jgi:ERCC4-related helicase
MYNSEKEIILQVNKGRIYNAQSEFDKKANPDNTQDFYKLKSCFGSSTSLFHAYDLLLNYGVEHFKKFISDFAEKEAKQNVSYIFFRFFLLY